MVRARGKLRIVAKGCTLAEDDDLDNNPNPNVVD